MYQRAKYTDIIRIGTALNNYCTILLVCKKTEKTYVRDKWKLVEAKDVNTENLWDCARVDVTHVDKEPVSGAEHCNGTKEEIWFDLRKSICRKHWSTFQDHVKYIHNEIVKPFRVNILHYGERVREMHDIYKYLPPP